MEPQETPISSAGNLDPQAVNLAKAIRQTESGGDFGAKGKSGEFGGYQFTPDTWSSASKEAGVNVPLDQASPEQQNQVAYTRIKKWKDEGYNPGQIASMWNAGQGEPNAYTGKFSNGQPAEGVNKHGVDYSVPDYAQAVARNYQALKGNSNSPQPQTPTSQSSGNGQPDWLSALEGVGAGALGWLGGHLATAAKIGLPIAGATLGSAIGPEGTAAGGIIGGEVGSAIAGMIPGDNSQNQNTQQTATPTQPQEQPQIPQIDFAQSAAASSAVKDAIMQSMQGNKSDRVFSNSNKGQSMINTAAQYGLVNPDENGNLTFNEEKRQDLLSQLANGEQKMIAAEGGSGTMQEVITRASKEIEGNKMLTPNERKEALDRVAEEAKSYAPIDGSMKLADMVQARHQQYAATRGKYGVGKTSAQITAHKALASGFRNTIAANVEDKGLYERLLGEEANLINAKGLEKKIQGRRPPKNKGVWEMFLRQGARVAEIYIGDKIGGPIGAIIGGLAGEQLNRKIEQRYGRNIFETKQMKAAMDILHEAKPKEYQELVSALKKQGIPFEPEKEPENDNVKEKVKDVKGDLKAIGKKGLVPRTIKQHIGKVAKNK